MKKLLILPVIFILLSLSGCTKESEKDYGDRVFLLELDRQAGGRITVDPPLPENGMLPAGTALTVKAVPDPGYIVDSCYKMIWIMENYNYGYFIESMKPETVFILDPADQRFQTMGTSDKYRIGASFIKKEALDGIKVTQDVVYSRNENKNLVYDVYEPENAKGKLPAVIIIHGGGWSSNSEDIMRGAAREIAATGRYVAFAIDYRLLSDLDADGNSIDISVVDIIEDVFGAIAHIRENAGRYHADPDNIAVTGDSAGGHLAAVVANMSDKIGSGGFNGESFEFLPSYIPRGKTAEKLRTEITAAIKAAAPSYGVFSFAGNSATKDIRGLLPPEAEPAWLEGISPIDNIPEASERRLPPQHCQIGTADPLIKVDDVRTYVEALKAAGHEAELVTAEGASHAYFDWKPDEQTKYIFNTTGKHQLGLMIGFFDSIFFP